MNISGMIMTCSGNESIGLRNAKKTVWLEQGKKEWLRVEWDKTNTFYAEFDRMELSFIAFFSF